MDTFWSKMFRYVATGAAQVAQGSVGQQSEQGCAAQGLPLSDCCAGPIQMGHYSGDWSFTFSKVTSSTVPPSLRNLR